jgi:hypothetical protein
VSEQEIDRRSSMSLTDTEAMKAAMKEGLKEWLDDKFASFGKWTLTSLACLVLAAFVWLILRSQGWTPPQQ